MESFDALPPPPVRAPSLRFADVADPGVQPHSNIERLRDHNAALTAALDLHPVGTILADDAGLVQFVSRSAEGLVGCRREEASGRPWLHLLPLADHDRDWLDQRLRWPAPEIVVRVALSGGTRRQVEIQVRSGPEGGRLILVRELSPVADLPRPVDPRTGNHGLIGDSQPMRLVHRQIEDVGRVDSTVLLVGETGTGKELAARAIHQCSERRHKPYVAVNCAGLTESLLASQLFGHRRGAFTGAVADHIGFLESADTGTLFLDEIGDVPMTVQTTLLRFLQEREIVRLGESRPRRVNVRIVAATNRDLPSAVATGAFREDLYYRLRIAQIDLPPLRHRLDDLPALVASFIAEARQFTRKHVHAISDDAMAALQQHHWPGNVRELRSAIESAVINARDPVIQREDLPRHVLPACESGMEQLLDALQRSGGNRAAAARMLGISRATFYRRLDAQKAAMLRGRAR